MDIKDYIPLPSSMRMQCCTKRLPQRRKLLAFFIFGLFVAFLCSIVLFFDLINYSDGDLHEIYRINNSPSKLENSVDRLKLQLNAMHETEKELELLLSKSKFSTIGHTDSGKIKQDIKEAKIRLEDKIIQDNLLGKLNVEKEHDSFDVRGAPSDPDILKRRDYVKNMMQLSWDGYKKYAWGYNEYKPLSHKPHSSGIFGSSRSGATIIDSLDTLYLMGMHQEFKEARDWVATTFTFEPMQSVSVFEVNIRFIGGLLSAFALTGDTVFKEKAKMIADKLLPAFNTRTGVPYSLLSLNSGRGSNFGWASGYSILAEIGTLHLEWAYLSHITGDQTYLDKVQKIRSTLKKAAKVGDGLYSNYINPSTGVFGRPSVSIGALGDSFYEYLLKSYIQSGFKDSLAKDMYYESIDKIEKAMLRQPDKGLMYIGEYHGSYVSRKMDHLACFIGGTIALGAQWAVPEKQKRHMEIGAGIANTCHQSYDQTVTKLGPDSFEVSGNSVHPSNVQYILRPEVVETYFYLWRLTKDPKYREWGWEAAQALNKYCRTTDGFSGISDVNSLKYIFDDVQQSFFLAETLKYLYLLFSDEDYVSLDSWVFNTEAHPLPVLS